MTGIRAQKVNAQETWLEKAQTEALKWVSGMAQGPDRSISSRFLDGTGSITVAYVLRQGELRFGEGFTALKRPGQ